MNSHVLLSSSYRIMDGGKQSLCSAWKGPFRFQMAAQAKTLVVWKKHVPDIKVAATGEQSDMLQSDARVMHMLDSSQGSSPGVLSSLDENEPELDDREKQRRMKIYKSMMGNIPWNKGRKHTPETRAKIRERTKIALQERKVRLKIARDKLMERSTEDYPICHCGLKLKLIYDSNSPGRAMDRLVYVCPSTISEGCGMRQKATSIQQTERKMIRELYFLASELFVARCRIASLENELEHVKNHAK